MRNDAINGKLKTLILINDKDEPSELIHNDSHLNQASTVPKPYHTRAPIENPPPNAKEVVKKPKRNSKVNNTKLFASNMLFKIKKRESTKSIEDSKNLTAV